MLTQEEKLIRDYLNGPATTFGRKPGELEGKHGLYAFAAGKGTHRRVLVNFVTAWLRHGYIEPQLEGTAVTITDKGKVFLSHNN
jgi:hypothetical protein